VRGVQEGARTIYAVGRQIIYTAIGIAAGIAALELHLHGEERFARWFVEGAAFMGLCLVLSSIFARPRRGR
jgi:hypothetical protein